MTSYESINLSVPFSLPCIKKDKHGNCTDVYELNDRLIHLFFNNVFLLLMQMGPDRTSVRNADMLAKTETQRIESVFYQDL